MNALVRDERWSARARNQFDAFTWDDETVVFVLSTGSTHALSPAASAVLATLLEHPDRAVSCREWLATLEPDAQADSAVSIDEELQALGDVLSELEHVGLVLRHET